MMRCVLAVAALVVASPAVQGADPIYTPPQPPPPIEPGPLLVRLFTMTLVVIAICSAILMGIRWLQRPRSPRGQASDLLRQLKSLHLTPRCTLELVEAMHTKIVFAIDPGGIKACHLIGGTFADVLNGVPETASPDSAPPTADEVSAFLTAKRQAA